MQRLKGAMHVLVDELSLDSEDSPRKGPGQDCAWRAGEAWRSPRGWNRVSEGERGRR